MHFSQEAFKGSHFKFKNDHTTTLDEISGGCSTGGDTLFCQNDDFLALNELVGFDSNTAKFKTVSYFFPNVDQIDARLNDGPTLVNSVENSLPQTSQLLIESILEQINKLSPVEKLLLYLKLPTGKDFQDPLKLPINPLGSRTEITQTIAWIKTHLKEDKDTSIPKLDVYTEYMEYCRENSMKPLSTADFGKVMKQVYPKVRPRRLGTRGNSRYCYSGMTCRAELPPPSLPSISCDDGERTCAWAAQVLGTPISSLTELEAHLASRGLPTSGRPLPKPTPLDNDLVYCMSSKISKPTERRLSEVENKRKVEEDSSSRSKTPKTPPERCKGKKRGSVKKSVTPCGSSKSQEELVKRSKGDTPKLPIPRLSRNQQKVELPFVRRLPKPLQPRQEVAFLENGNSLEQEEELLRYFRSGSEEPKVSQLRLLLEKKEDKAQARRRVSFEAVPESPKKFSFAPISPVSPFVQPQRVLHRSSSVSSPVGKVLKLPPAPVTRAGERSQSVPMLFPQDTPVPSEIIDFGLNTDSTDLLVIDETSEPLLMDPGMNNDNLNAIFSYISEIETHSRSHPNTPTTYSHSAQLSDAPSTSTFFDDIDCDVTLNSLTVELNSDVL